MTRRYEKNSNLTTIGYKSALIIMLASVVGSALMPLILGKIGITWKLIHVIVSGLIPAYTTAYCLYFIETDRGYTKQFFKVFIALFAIIAFISFFWMYELVWI